MKRLVGYSYISPAVPICATRPSFMIAIRVETVIASSWSWVTITKVRPRLSWMLTSSNWVALAQLLVERAQRLVEQQHLGALDDRTGQRHALLLAAGELVRPARLAPFQLDQAHRLGDPVA